MSLWWMVYGETGLIYKSNTLSPWIHQRGRITEDVWIQRFYVVIFEKCGITLLCCIIGRQNIWTFEDWISQVLPSMKYVYILDYVSISGYLILRWSLNLNEWPWHLIKDKDRIELYKCVRMLMYSRYTGSFFWSKYLFCYLYRWWPVFVNADGKYNVLEISATMSNIFIVSVFVMDNDSLYIYLFMRWSCIYMGVWRFYINSINKYFIYSLLNIV